MSKFQRLEYVAAAAAFVVVAAAAPLTLAAGAFLGGRAAIAVVLVSFAFSVTGLTTAAAANILERL